MVQTPIFNTGKAPSAGAALQKTSVRADTGVSAASVGADAASGTPKDLSAMDETMKL